MHLVFDIFQGMGVAAAIGIRPFLPALVVGVLGAGNVEIHFNHTAYGFLQATVFLLVLVALVMVFAFLERRLPEKQMQGTRVASVIAVCSLVLGALFFAGSLARGHYAAWPGLIGGAVCAAIGVAATRPLYVRVRQRLDEAAAAAVPLFFEGVAVGFAVLSVLLAPIGLIGVVLLVWLLVAGRRRADQKYAGLRILR